MTVLTCVNGSCSLSTDISRGAEELTVGHGVSGSGASVRTAASTKYSKYMEIVALIQTDFYVCGLCAVQLRHENGRPLDDLLVTHLSFLLSSPPLRSPLSTPFLLSTPPRFASSSLPPPPSPHFTLSRLHITTPLLNHPPPLRPRPPTSSSSPIPSPPSPLSSGARVLREPRRNRGRGEYPARGEARDETPLTSE